MRLIKLVDTLSKERLADGCILPDGQVAVAWWGEIKTHGTYPSLEALEAIQAKLPHRAIQDYEATYDEFCLNLHTYTFQLVRDEDVNGLTLPGLKTRGFLSSPEADS